MPDHIIEDEECKTAEYKKTYSKLDIFFITVTILIILILILTFIFLLYLIWPDADSKKYGLSLPLTLERGFINFGIIGKLDAGDAGLVLAAYPDASSDVKTVALKRDLSADITERVIRIFEKAGYYKKNDIERIYMLIVMICGAIGSMAFALRGLGKHLGLQDFEVSWLVSYFIKPFLGASVALISYFLIKGGILSGNAAMENINIYGVAAISGLIGMFSEQAIYKLKDLFDIIFTKVETKKNAEVPRTESPAEVPVDLPADIALDDDSNEKFVKLQEEERELLLKHYRTTDNKNYTLINKQIDNRIKRNVMSIINKFMK